MIVNAARSVPTYLLVPLLRGGRGVLEHNHKKNNHQKMKHRPYGKTELALLYQPNCNPESALRTLNRWINGCPLLVEELRALQYQPRRHTFLPREVEAIVRHLGEP